MRLRLAAMSGCLLTACAGGYYAGLGGGRPVSLRGDLPLQFVEGDGAGRVVAGKRVGPWAVEGVFFGADLRNAVGVDYSTASLGLDAKLHVPVGLGLELYLRGGLNHTWLEGPDAGAGGYRGRGLAYGTGVQWKSPDLGLAQLALWLDFNQQVVHLHRAGSPELDGKIGMVTAGISAGRDF